MSSLNGGRVSGLNGGGPSFDKRGSIRIGSLWRSGRPPTGRPGPRGPAPAGGGPAKFGTPTAGTFGAALCSMLSAVSGSTILKHELIIKFYEWNIILLKIK